MAKKAEKAKTTAREKRADAKGSGAEEQLQDVPFLEEPPARGFIVQRKDGTVFVGCGYSAGKAMPYFYPIGQSMECAKVYKTQRGAREAAEKYDGIVGVVELDPDGKPANWLGYAIRLGSYDRYAVYGKEKQ